MQLSCLSCEGRCGQHADILPLDPWWRDVDAPIIDVRGVVYLVGISTVGCQREGLVLNGERDTALVKILIGVEEDVLPHRNSLDDNAVEEERRLMYVGITRAQRTLCLSYAAQRRRYGETHAAKPSRFLEELPEELLNWQGRDEEKDSAESKQRARSHLAGLRELLAE